MDIDVSSLIVAITGALALVLGERSRRKGDRSKARQEEAANALAAQKQEFDQQGEIIDRLREENARLVSARDAEQEACNRARRDLSTSMVALLAVVHDEVARTAAEDALRRSDRHEQTDH